MFRVVDNLVKTFLGLLSASCVEAVHVKNTTVFTVFTSFNNYLTIKLSAGQLQVRLTVQM